MKDLTNRADYSKPSMKHNIRNIQVYLFPNDTNSMIVIKMMILLKIMLEISLV